MPLVGERRSTLILVFVLCFTVVSIPQIELVNAEPVAEFSFNPQSPLVGEEISFVASGSYDVNGNIVSYMWDFGDGTSYITINPITTHTYNSANTYNVSLKVTNNQGLNSSYFFRTLAIRVPTSINLRAYCSEITLVDFQVRITGSLHYLDDVYENQIGFAPLVLSYAFEGTSQYLPLPSVITSRGGDYVFIWIPPASGCFTLKVEYEGNSKYIGSSNIISISSLSVQDQYVFSAISKSTLSNLFFNTTDRKLSFNAKADSKTQGYVKISIPKALVSTNYSIDSLSNMRSYIDGNEKGIGPTIQEMGQGDILHFSFNYDSGFHQIVVDLDITVVPEFSSGIILLLILVASSVVILTKQRFNTKLE